VRAAPQLFAETFTLVTPDTLDPPRLSRRDDDVVLATAIRCLQGRHDVVALNFCERARGHGDTVDATLGLRESQRRTCRGHDSTLDDVLKFTNVAWPRMVLQRGNHVVRDFLNLLALVLVLARSPRRSLPAGCADTSRSTARVFLAMPASFES
jgi:hypothetical protein